MGPVSAETVKQLEDVLQARARAMAQGDRNAFLQTIDATRPAFRRTQLREFDVPTARGTLNSTFRISKPERYHSYVRGFVEETLEGNAFPGAFAGGTAYARRYFRSEGDGWVLTEPTADETGPEKRRSTGDLEVIYWAMDEDVADTLLNAAADARRHALTQSPKPQQLPWSVGFVPTAELAGPGWDGFTAGLSGSTHDLLYPLWWAFGPTQEQVSALTQYQLRAGALQRVRDAIAPGVSSRLSLDVWLDDGWIGHAAGLDASVTLRQSCAGVPIPSLRQLAEGPPSVTQPGIAPETFGRHYSYSTAMVAYLFEKHGSDAFWKLMSAFVLSSSSATNFPMVLGVTPDQFYAAWLVWLKKQYC